MHCIWVRCRTYSTPVPGCRLSCAQRLSLGRWDVVFRKRLPSCTLIVVRARTTPRLVSHSFLGCVAVYRQVGCSRHLPALPPSTDSGWGSGVSVPFILIFFVFPSVCHPSLLTIWLGIRHSFTQPPIRRTGDYPLCHATSETGEGRVEQRRSMPSHGVALEQRRFFINNARVTVCLTAAQAIHASAYLFRLRASPNR